MTDIGPGLLPHFESLTATADVAENADLAVDVVNEMTKDHSCPTASMTITSVKSDI